MMARGLSSADGAGTPRGADRETESAVLAVSARGQSPKSPVRDRDGRGGCASMAQGRAFAERTERGIAARGDADGTRARAGAQPTNAAPGIHRTPSRQRALVREWADGAVGMRVSASGRRMRQHHLFDVGGDRRGVSRT